MSETSLERQTIALAALLQASYLVDLIARTGSAPAESINPSIHSLFRFEAATATEIYGGLPGIDLGLRLLRDILRNGRGAERQALHYAMGLIHLQKKVTGNPEMLRVLQSRLQHAALKSEHFSNDIRQISGSIAAIYQDTVSTFRYRIQVTGSLQQLQNESNAEMIRALLLAGIRAAVLWRQSGGKRWHFVTRRQQFLAIIDDWLPVL